MKSVTLLWSLASIGTIYSAAAQCNRDNCYRAVLGTALGFQQASYGSDCASLLGSTSIPPTVTYTVTQTSTPNVAIFYSTFTPPLAELDVTTTPNPTVLTLTASPPVTSVFITITPPATVITITAAPVKKRAQTTLTTAASSSFKLPAYASACSGISRYSSVCSCGGVSPTTVVLPAPTTTATITTVLAQATSISTVSLVQQTTTITITAPQQTITSILTPNAQTVVVQTTLAQQTSTAIAVPIEIPPPALCDNGGIEWSTWTSIQPSSGNPDPKSYDLSQFRQQYARTASAYTTFLGLMRLGPNKLSYSPLLSRVDADLTVLHRGYVYASTTGNYLFTASDVSMFTQMWIGKFAFSGWNADNVDQFVVYNYTGSQKGKGTAAIHLEAGNYYPIRILYRQIPFTFTSSFLYSIISPSGKVLIDSTLFADPTPYVVQYTCDGVSGPKYPFWDDKP